MVSYREELVPAVRSGEELKLLLACQSPYRTRSSGYDERVKVDEATHTSVNNVQNMQPHNRILQTDEGEKNNM